MIYRSSVGNVGCQRYLEIESLLQLKPTEENNYFVDKEVKMRHYKNKWKFEALQLLIRKDSLKLEGTLFCLNID